MAAQASLKAMSWVSSSVHSLPVIDIADSNACLVNVFISMLCYLSKLGLLVLSVSISMIWYAFAIPTLLFYFNAAIL